MAGVLSLATQASHLGSFLKHRSPEQGNRKLWGSGLGPCNRTCALLFSKLLLIMNEVTGDMSLDVEQKHVHFGEFLLRYLF